MNAKAFTLLELLLATVLSTLLMVGVLAVVVRVGGQDVVVTKPGPAGTFHSGVAARCVSLLREDLRHAMSVSYSQRGDALFIHGYSDLGSETRSLTHRPVQIVYRLERINGRTWLVRRQRRLDVLTNQAADRELVASGIQRFAVFTPGRAKAGSADRGTISAVGPDLTQATDAADPNFASTRPPAPLPEDPYENIFVARLANNFYRRYIPEWVGYRGNAAEEPRQAPGIGTTESDGSPRARRTGSAIAKSIPQTAWRVQIWTQPEADPIVDQTMMLVGGAGR